MSKLSIHISDFRAIHEADIDIQGITVLTGLNATGKSTISRMMYYVGHYANHYEELLNESLYRQMWTISPYLYQSLDLLDEQTLQELIDCGYKLWDRFFDEKQTEIIVQGLLDYYGSGAQVKNVDRERLGKVLGKQLKRRETFLAGLREMKDRVDVIYSKHKRQITERPSTHLQTKLNELFKTTDENLLDRISFSENGADIVSGQRKSVGLFTSLDTALYIDTPMVVNMQRGTSDSMHWNQLISLFEGRNTNSLTSDDSSNYLISELSRVMGGELVYPENRIGINRNQPVYFQGKAGEKIQINEVASGIKSFAILQSLLQKGLLNDRTILIIDEPEAHLHPQWVVEYARLIIELNRTLGCKVLIATHSTDMVQSLYLFKEEYMQEVAQNEAPLSLNFYLAEGSDEATHRYTFMDCEGDIEPIFKVFNRSLDLITQYTPRLSSDE